MHLTALTPFSFACSMVPCLIHPSAFYWCPVHTHLPNAAPHPQPRQLKTVGNSRMDPRFCRVPAHAFFLYSSFSLRGFTSAGLLSWRFYGPPPKEVFSMEVIMTLIY